MMEEVSTEDTQDVTSKVADLKIVNQLQDAAQTNVTQGQTPGHQGATSGSREGSPAVATPLAPPTPLNVSLPSELPANLMASPLQMPSTSASPLIQAGMPPPPTGGFVPTPGAITATPPKGYLEKTAAMAPPVVGAEAYPAGVPSAYQPPVTPPSTSYPNPMGLPGAGAVNYSPGAPTQSYTTPPGSAQIHYEGGTSSVTLEGMGDTMGPVYPHPDESHQGAGLLGWLSSSSFVHKVMEKTKSSVESMITTLDPGMKEVIHGGGNIDIIVTSDKEIKVAPVRQAFQEVFGRATVDGMASQPNIASQPVGYTAAVKGAEERAENLRISGAIDERQAIVSVENFIAELLPNKWYDLPCLLLLDPTYNVRLEVFGQAVPVPAEYVMEAQDATPPDYDLRWSGLAVTVGEVVARHRPGVHHADWHRALTGVSRADMIRSAARVLAGMYKERIPAQVGQDDPATP